MNLKIENKIALVTGAGRGLGKKICESLDNEGVNIIAVSRGLSSLKELEKKLDKNKNHHFFEIDFQEKDSVRSLNNKLEKINLAPDIIVNNLGGNLNYTDPLKTFNGWREVMRLNVEVAIEINELYIHHMIKQKWGRICHISSISALENQGPPSYCAAKAALNAYVRSVGRYVSNHNVILTSVMPGAVFTEGGYWDIASKERPDHVNKYLNERMAIRRFGTEEEISNVVAFMCSDLSSFCVGTSILVDGGQGRVF
jgi:3-oxoacyl-[acyl-carrier protein] reductase